MICDICNKPINGYYLYDNWGTKTHPQHNGRETARCYCCHKYVDDTNRGYALKYGDGRVICRACHDNAVNSSETGRKSKTDVFMLFKKAGIALPEDRIKLVINDKKYAEQSLGKGSFHGLMRANWKTGFLGPHREYIINIISGLHYVVFNGVLAHELMHVYITENCINLSHKEEEGLCELICYYMHEASKTKIGNIQMQTMINNPDPVYGDGFRLMKSKIDKVGSWSKLMAELK
jgi:hypothetical protein